MSFADSIYLEKWAVKRKVNLASTDIWEDLLSPEELGTEQASEEANGENAEGEGEKWLGDEEMGWAFVDWLDVHLGDARCLEPDVQDNVPNAEMEGEDRNWSSDDDVDESDSVAVGAKRRWLSSRGSDDSSNDS